jgi:hypothetical protein
MIDTLESTDHYRVIKLGKFSAIQISDLFVGGKAKKGEETPLFGKGAMTYIRKVAKDQFDNVDEAYLKAKERV